jgi:hypothetical protein
MDVLLAQPTWWDVMRHSFNSERVCVPAKTSFSLPGKLTERWTDFALKDGTLY